MDKEATIKDLPKILENNNLLANSKKNVLISVFACPGGGYEVKSRFFSYAGYFQNTGDSFYFSDIKDAQRKMHDMAKIKIKKGGYFWVGEMDMRRYYQYFSFPENHIDASFAADFLKHGLDILFEYIKIKHMERIITFNNKVSSFFSNGCFDSGLEYMAILEKENDSYIVYDNFGDKVTVPLGSYAVEKVRRAYSKENGNELEEPSQIFTRIIAKGFEESDREFYDFFCSRLTEIRETENAKKT